MTEQSAKIRKYVNFLLRAVIIILTYGFIYHQIFLENKLDDLSDVFLRLAERQDVKWILALMMLLMFINWGIESFKWKLLISRIEHVSFFRSFKAVMAGISVSLFMPNRTGDYLGRVFILEKGNHVEGIFSTIIGSFAQMIITFGIGLLCLLTFTDHYFRESLNIGEYMFMSLVFLVPVMVFALIMIYLKVGVLAEFLSRFLPGRWPRLKKNAAIFSRYSAGELSRVLLLSFLRYIVFSTQFYILIRVFGAPVPAAEGFVLIPVIYLAMALVPTFALVELGVRGTVSLFIFGLYFEKAGIVDPQILLAPLAASSLLWLINLVLPAVIGTFFVFSLKFFRK
ncbi:MAG: flippase-like domain-containing protein [Bacteroidales bacterium]|nr:flippase-like domain-containing protein [Bacteroidales bacterium]